MTVDDLNKMLSGINESEQRHIKYPGKLSPHYDKLLKDQNDNYIFQFENLLKNSNICIKKFSRFTPIPSHIHTVLELNYVYQGKCVQNINDTTLVLQQGDVLLLDTNTVHSIEPLSENDIIIQIDMRKAFLSVQLLTRLSSQGVLSYFLAQAVSQATTKKQYLYFNSNDNYHLRVQIQELLIEYFGQNPPSNEIIDASMIIIFSQLLRIFHRNQCIHYMDKTNNNRIFDILKYIEGNYMTATLGNTAQRFSLQPNYLSRYIKDKSGKTFQELVLIQKLSIASFQLINSDKPIYQIAHDIGYENLGFFYQKFQHQYGMTPQEYRTYSVTYDIYHHQT